MSSQMDNFIPLIGESIHIGPYPVSFEKTPEGRFYIRKPEAVEIETECGRAVYDPMLDNLKVYDISFENKLKAKIWCNGHVMVAFYGNKHNSLKY